MANYRVNNKYYEAGCRDVAVGTELEWDGETLNAAGYVEALESYFLPSELDLTEEEVVVEGRTVTRSTTWRDGDNSFEVSYTGDSVALLAFGPESAVEGSGIRFIGKDGLEALRELVAFLDVAEIQLRKSV